MKSVIEQYPEVVDQVSEAMLDVGLTPKASPIRGGTDGAILSLKGLPTPNLGTGGYNYHGPYEYCDLTEMKKAVELLLAILRNNTRNIY
jgi:tripeptide aminopeptidase